MPVEDHDFKWRRAHAALDKLGRITVSIGIHGDDDKRRRKKGEQASNIDIGTVHEFGATFTPGGTPYVRSRKTGRLMFIRKGTKRAAKARVTKPHSITIPERSYLRATIDEDGDKILELLDEQLEDLLFGRTTAHKVMAKAGIYTEGLVKKRIYSGIAPPLKQGTIKRKTVRGKAGTTPLVDTGQLAQSITHVVHQGAA